MLARLCGFGAVVLVTAGTLFAQSVPIVAKMRLTDEVTVNGKVTVTHVQEGIFYRASSGSELRQWKTLDGKAEPGTMGWGLLMDKQHDTHYKVDYVGRNAYKETLPEIGLPKHGKSDPSGQDSVEGIGCDLWPIHFVPPGKAPILTGQGCRSAQYELDLYYDYTNAPTSTGKVAHSAFKLYDIQIGVEPDPKLFDLETNFTIYTTEAKK